MSGALSNLPYSSREPATRTMLGKNKLCSSFTCVAPMYTIYRGEELIINFSAGVLWVIIISFLNKKEGNFYSVRHPSIHLSAVRTCDPTWVRRHPGAFAPTATATDMHAKKKKKSLSDYKLCRFVHLVYGSINRSSKRKEQKLRNVLFGVVQLFPGHWSTVCPKSDDFQVQKSEEAFCTCRSLQLASFVYPILYTALL